MEVPWITTGPLLWNQETMTQAPNEEGVYAIISITERLYIGKGKIKERLISHWNKQNAQDRCIWSKRPVRCCWEVCADSDTRMAELLKDYPTLCNSALR